MHDKTTWKEKLFASKLDNYYHWYLSKDEGWLLCHKFSFDFNNDKRTICQNVLRDLSFSCECMPKQ